MIIQNNLPFLSVDDHSFVLYYDYLSFFLSLVVVKRHERRATADLRCDGDIEGDRHRASRRRLAAAVLDDPEGRRPGRRPGDLQVARLHGDFPRRGLPGLLRPLQVRAVCLISRRVPADEARTLLSSHTSSRLVYVRMVLFLTCTCCRFVTSSQAGVSRGFPVARCHRGVHGRGGHRDRDAAAQGAAWPRPFHQQHRCCFCPQGCLLCTTT